MTKGKMAIGKTMIYNILHRKLDWAARNALKKPGVNARDPGEHAVTTSLHTPVMWL